MLLCFGSVWSPCASRPSPSTVITLPGFYETAPSVDWPFMITAPYQRFVAVCPHVKCTRTCGPLPPRTASKGNIKHLNPAESNSFFFSNKCNSFIHWKQHCSCSDKCGDCTVSLDVPQMFIVAWLLDISNPGFVRNSWFNRNSGSSLCDGLLWMTLGTSMMVVLLDGSRRCLTGVSLPIKGRAKQRWRRELTSYKGDNCRVLPFSSTFNLSFNLHHPRLNNRQDRAATTKVK